jgi:L-amino acid N-acyltransferase YncA
MENKILVRRATAADMEAIFKLSNHPSVRAVSFAAIPISWEEHVSWYRRAILDPACGFYVAEIDGRLSGQLRFYYQDEQITVSISIDPSFRGRGVGSTLYRQSLADFRILHPLDKVIARIKKNNEESLAFFKKLGFQTRSIQLFGGIESYLMVDEGAKQCH